MNGGDTNLTPIEIMLEVDENGQTTVKKLYEFLQLNKSNYSTWAKRNIINNNFAEESIDYWSFVVNDERNPNPTTDYKITASFAKKLCMTSKTKRGEQARDYFIKVEDILKEKSKEKKLILPTDYESALEELIKQVRKNKKLSIENTKFKKTEKENKPKLELYERLLNGKNTVTMGEVAKTLNIQGMGRNDLFAILRELKILMKNNVPYQKYLENGKYFKVTFKSIAMHYGIENIPVTNVTAKGLEFIHKQLKKYRYIDEDNNVIKKAMFKSPKGTYYLYNKKTNTVW